MALSILVTGVGGPAGSAAARYFRSRGHSVIGTVTREVDSDANELIVVPHPLDASYPSTLLQIIRDRRPALLIPTVTGELPVISRLRGQIQGLGCMVFISSPSAIEVTSDKLKTAWFMQERGVSVPVTLGPESSRLDVAGTLGLPVVAKPCLSGGASAVALHTTIDEVLSEGRDGILFQEYIPGDEFDVNLFVDHTGQAKAAVSLRKTGLKDGADGGGASVVKDINQDAIGLCLRAASLLGLEGPLDFDVRLRRDGTPVLLQINARLGCNSMHAAEVLDKALECLVDLGRDSGAPGR